MRVLIVEDEAIVALSLAWELEAHGHTVIGPAASDTEALEFVRTDRPDVALIDLTLHGREVGISLATLLKLSYGIPVIFVTGQPGVARAHPDLAIGVIKKPYRTETVTKALSMAADRLAGRTPVSTASALEL